MINCIIVGLGGFLGAVLQYLLRSGSLEDKNVFERN